MYRSTRKASNLSTHHYSRHRYSRHRYSTPEQCQHDQSCSVNVRATKFSSVAIALLRSNSRIPARSLH